MKKLIGLFALVLILVVGCSKQEPTQPLGDQLDVSSAISKVEPELAELVDASSVRGSSIVVPSGSQDALADAIAQAGENGTVVLASGMHYESDMVIISQTVQILGEDGAVLRIDSQSDPAVTDIVLDAGLYVYNASRVVISNLEIRPQNAPGGVAILLENAPNSSIVNNKIYDHQFSVVVQNGDDSRILQNTIDGTPAWQTGALDRTVGILVLKGVRVLVSRNDVATNVFGIFASDARGKMTKNTTHDNFIGTILCKMPMDLILPSGVVAGSVYACNYWTVTDNNSYNNFDAGYLIIDGANNNKLMRNAGDNNGTYDYEFVGETDRFGFLAPTSRDNVAYTGDLLTKDCGLNNTVIGTNLVDITQDPCY